jgi:predicted SnoaL-like aldol condensation-catalyzing enzyme
MHSGIGPSRIVGKPFGATRCPGMRSIDIWRVEDGMFAEHWDELNLLEMFQQMGALPPLGAGPERDA